jgi:hypothetical protein
MKTIKPGDLTKFNKHLTLLAIIEMLPDARELVNMRILTPHAIAKAKAKTFDCLKK